MKTVRLSESCTQWSFSDALTEKAVRTTLGAFRTLQDSQELREAGVTDIVPAYTSLAVHFPHHEKSAANIEAAVNRLLMHTKPLESETAPLHKLPVIYDGEDLPRVARRCNLTETEVIRRHTAPVYLVAMIGFQPHFPYLYGLDPQLAIPRLKTPRLTVPAGAVAIGGEQTGVYPSESPGGWNLIGHTDADGLKLICPGDRVQFTEQHEN